MKNLFLIPTDSPSMLHLCNNKTHILSVEPTIKNDLYKSFPQHIYITSDEEIKGEDWVIETEKKVIFKAQNHIKDYSHSTLKKIFTTNDQILIKDGVRAIDSMFLEWFVENPTCDYVDRVAYVSIGRMSGRMATQTTEDNNQTISFSDERKVCEVKIDKIDNFQKFVESMEVNIKYWLPANFRYKWIRIEQGTDYFSEEEYFSWAMEYNYDVAGTSGYIYPLKGWNTVKRFKTKKGATKNFYKAYADYFEPLCV